MCIELIILYRTDIIEKVNNSKNKIFNKQRLYMNFSCVYTKLHKHITNASISTKSQFHHPPQESSCSAHQQPSNTEKTKSRFCITYMFV